MHNREFSSLQALVVCLESKDYIQIRNALIILIKILPHFPVLSKLAQIIEKKVEKIIEDEKTENRGLATLAVSYNGLLKTKSAQFIREQDFHLVSAAKLGPKAIPQKGTEKSNGFASQVSTSQNKPEAPQPVQSVMSSASVVANPISVVVGNKEVREDGEKSKGKYRAMFRECVCLGW